MKKLWKIILIAIGIVFVMCVSLFFLLRGNSPIRSDEPFADILRDHAVLVQNNQWDAILGSLTYAYALHDIDGNGTMALLVSDPGRLDIFVTQNDVAVHINSFPIEDEGNNAILWTNGIITQLYGSDLRYFRFEDGMFVRFATLTSRAGIGHIHVLADGTEIPITQEEFTQISVELREGGEIVHPDWRPLAGFR